MSTRVAPTQKRTGTDPQLLRQQRTIHWCPGCQSPVAFAEPTNCPRCGTRTAYLATDIRPVFARERRILQFYGHGHLLTEAVWKASKAKQYFIGGRPVTLPDAGTLARDLSALAEFIRDSDHYDAVDEALIASYRQALALNEPFLRAQEDEAFTFITQVAKRYGRRLQLVSFSGGKDSTVVSHLVRRALGRSDIMHVFGDTTLEDPNTYQYLRDFQAENPLVPFYEARAEHDFHALVEHMGPPSRQMRWCCTIFKAGPINNLLQTLGPKVKALTFYGIRHDESVRRADYHAVTTGAKIGTQVTASPIIEWREFDVWLYILLNELTFNKSYRLGYTRVGCWLCPLNSNWSDMLAEIFFPDDAERWRHQLVSFAAKIGKPDPEEYIAAGGWKARFGGAGMPNRFTGHDAKPCGDMEDTLQYTLNRPVSEELFEFLKPLGRIRRDLGNPTLGEFLVQARTDEGQPIKPARDANRTNLRIQAPLGSDTVRVTFLPPREPANVEQLIKYQLNKFQTCIQCTACSAVCPHGAITVRPEQRVYAIDEDKCTGCLECVTHFGGTGCLVAKSLSSYGEGKKDRQADAAEVELVLLPLLPGPASDEEA